MYPPGLAFLDKSLFTSFRFTEPEPQNTPDNSSDVEYEQATFQISLSALLETLSIFGATDTNKDRFLRDPYTSGVGGPRHGTSLAFDNRTLGVAGLCRISYRGVGDSLNITLEEGNVTTTCSLTTYEPESFEDIHFDRDSLTLKIIMRSSLLYDAIQELSSTNPERLTLVCAPTGSAAISLSATGTLGSAAVDFSNEPQLLETFQCHERDMNVYKFSMIRAAVRAMSIASKVSIRVDNQGVLSLQFMIELVELEGKVSFVDFRFVPFLLEPDDEDDTGHEEQESQLD